MKAKIVFYSQKKISPEKRTKFKKELSGHNDSSHGGRYNYRIKGILDNINYIKPCNASLIIKNKDLNKIINLLDKYTIDYKIYTIEINKEEFNK